MRRACIELANGIYRVPHIGDFLNSFIVLEGDGSVTLIDTGLAAGPPRVLRALSELGRHPQDVQRIVLTHAHADHAGGAASLVQQTGAPGVRAHEEDVPYLERGEAPPVNAGRRMAAVLNRIQRGTFDPVPVAPAVADGDVLDVGGGMRVLHTPGHTPGHVSLLFEESGVLVTGDCILNPLGRRIWPFGVFCVSPSENAASAARLADVEFEVAAFTHGPSIHEGARERIRSFLTRKGALAT